MAWSYFHLAITCTRTRLNCVMSDKSWSMLINSYIRSTRAQSSLSSGFRVTLDERIRRCGSPSHTSRTAHYSARLCRSNVGRARRATWRQGRCIMHASLSPQAAHSIGSCSSRVATAATSVASSRVATAATSVAARSALASISWRSCRSTRRHSARVLSKRCAYAAPCHL